MILSTHNLDEAERLADRVGVLRGRFLAIASPTDLRRRIFGARVRVRVHGDARRFVKTVTGAGAKDVSADGSDVTFSLDAIESGTPAVVRALVQAGADVVSVAPEDRPLEDVYFALVGRSAGEEPSQP